MSWVSVRLLIKGWLFWNGPVRLIFWRWRASEKERVLLKQRVRELEDEIRTLRED